jgi:hypothetical protein
VLSEQQKHVLRWLLQAVRALEGRNDSAARSLLRDGIGWQPRTADKDRENCWRASLCRTLARLEQRGLLTRIRGRKNARTVRVLFTDQGRKVAESMIRN